MQILTTDNRQTQRVLFGAITGRKAFTLIELLVTMSIIVIMALVAIPGFGKSQRLIELQSKSDEVKSAFDEMHIKAMNPEKGVERYYAKLTETASGVTGKVEYGSWGGGATNPSVYKTVNLTSDQTLTKALGLDAYLVCNKGKSFCCNATSEIVTCDTAFSNTVAGTFFFTITNSDKTTTFKIFANPFKVTAVTADTL